MRLLNIPEPHEYRISSNSIRRVSEQCVKIDTDVNCFGLGFGMTRAQQFCSPNILPWIHLRFKGKSLGNFCQSKTWLRPCSLSCLYSAEVSCLNVFFCSPCRKSLWNPWISDTLFRELDLCGIYRLSVSLKQVTLLQLFATLINQWCSKVLWSSDPKAESFQWFNAQVPCLLSWHSASLSDVFGDSVPVLWDDKKHVPKRFDISSRAICKTALLWFG